MTDTPINSSQRDRGAPGLRPSYGFGGSQARFELDAADLRVIATAFGFSVQLVVAAALAVDAYLLEQLRLEPSTLGSFGSRQLALDLLPWTLVFTVVALTGLAIATGVRRHIARVASPSSGFLRRSI